MKIAWLVNHINQVGGIEQVVYGLSQHFSCVLGHEVEIISINSDDGRPFFPLDLSVPIRHCGLNWRDETPKRFRETIRRVLRELDADILLTCHPRISTAVLMNRSLFHGKIIVTQHSTCDSFGAKRRMLNAVFFRFADALVVLNKPDQNFYRRTFCKALIIPNALFSAVSGVSDLKEPVLVAAGRLTEVKGFDMLVDAFAAAAPQHPQWSLFICGDGDQMEALKQRSARLGMADRIHFPGFVKTTDYMRRASGYVLSSRSESFSLVLLEAFAHGLPVVSFELPAIMEVSQNTGILTAPCNDVSALSAQLDQLMASDDLRRKLSREARKRAEHYTVEAIADQWMSLFHKLLD